MAINKCVKLFLILVLVGFVAFGVTFLPFNLSDKFKAVVNKVSNHLRGLAGSGSDNKVHVDFSKRDSYTHGSLNIVLDKLDNVPKEGYLKFLHKGEKDAPLDVEKFTMGDTDLEGLEFGLLDYAAGYFKGEDTHLLLVELCLHKEEPKGEGENTTTDNKNATTEGNNGEKGAQPTNNTNGADNTTNGTGPKGTGKGDKTVEKTEGEKLFFAPGENNKWVKLPPEADLGAKVDEVFAALSANTPENQQGTAPPATAGPGTPPAQPNLDLPAGESPVPPPQDYPLTYPKVPGATGQLAGPSVPGPQPGNDGQGAGAGNGSVGGVMPGDAGMGGQPGMAGAAGGPGALPVPGQLEMGGAVGGQNGNNGGDGAAQSEGEVPQGGKGEGLPAQPPSESAPGKQKPDASSGHSEGAGGQLGQGTAAVGGGARNGNLLPEQPTPGLQGTPGQTKNPVVNQPNLTETPQTKLAGSTVQPNPGNSQTSGGNQNQTSRENAEQRGLNNGGANGGGSGPSSGSSGDTKTETKKVLTGETTVNGSDGQKK